jgi:hypothetical protein
MRETEEYNGVGEYKKFFFCLKDDRGETNAADEEDGRSWY